MAVELRCPDCRAKLRLKTPPEPGTEVECPKCGTAFEAPDEEGAAKADLVKELKGAKDRAEKPKDKAPKAAPPPQGPRKRRAKKRETSKAALIGAIAAALLMFITATATLVWFFTRVPKAVEMLYYAPEDAQNAYGINIGHAQKYPEFYKAVSGSYGSLELRTVGDAIAKAAGMQFMEQWVDNVVVATSAANGSVIVYRTRTEFDGAALAKLDGAKQYTEAGKSYYLVPALGGGAKRAFAPTNRLVVVTPTSTPNPVFHKMLNGHDAGKDKTMGVRMGDLGAKVTRGTFWRMRLFDTVVKPVQPPEPKAGTEDTNAVFEKTAFEAINGCKGFGVKASLGSKEVRFELDVWYNDSDKSTSVKKKWQEHELSKGDEGTPPRWFKDKSNGFGDKKVQAQLLNNISFGNYGDVFYGRTSVVTTELQQTASQAIGEVLGTRATGGFGIGGPGMAFPGAPGGPGPGGPAPGGPAPGGPKQRRRPPARRRATA